MPYTKGDLESTHTWRFPGFRSSYRRRSGPPRASTRTWGLSSPANHSRRRSRTQVSGSAWTAKGRWIDNVLSSSSGSGADLKFENLFLHNVLFSILVPSQRTSPSHPSWQGTGARVSWWVHHFPKTFLNMPGVAGFLLMQFWNRAGIISLAKIQSPGIIRSGI